jgi:hypothetical protein
MNHFYHFAIPIGIVGGGRVIVAADAMGASTQDGRGEWLALCAVYAGIRSKEFPEKGTTALHFLRTRCAEGGDKRPTSVTF